MMQLALSKINTIFCNNNSVSHKTDLKSYHPLINTSADDESPSQGLEVRVHSIQYLQIVLNNGNFKSILQKKSFKLNSSFKIL